MMHEKTAAGAGAAIAKGMLAAGRLIGEHPLASLGVLGTIGTLGVLTDLANKVRGAHQITSEASKAKRMDYQTKLLQELVANSKPVYAQPKKSDEIIIPPLR